MKCQLARISSDPGARVSPEIQGLFLWVKAEPPDPEPHLVESISVPGKLYKVEGIILTYLTNNGEDISIESDLLELFPYFADQTQRSLRDWLASGGDVIPEDS